jgi:hypothetical protein
MRAISTTVVVGPNHLGTVSLPSDIPAGAHQAVLVLADRARQNSRSASWNLPVIDVGPWPPGLSLRREDMYGDDGR